MFGLTRATSPFLSGRPFSGRRNIFGGRSAAAAVPLLDQFGVAATGAYSTRLLRAAYAGSAIRVRRSSDDTEQDIGFAAGDLDTAAMLTFCGAGNGFVSKWYDQSGNTKDFVQATTANQPQIVSSGVTITTLNGTPSPQFNGTSQVLTGAALSNFITAAAYTLFSLSRPTAGGTSHTDADNAKGIFSDPSTGYFEAGYGSDDFIAYHFGVAAHSALVSATFPGVYVASQRYDHVNLSGYLNGGPGTSSAVSLDVTDITNLTAIGRSFARFFAGTMGELLLFNTALSTANMNIVGASQAARGGVTWTTI